MTKVQSPWLSRLELLLLGWPGEFLDADLAVNGHTINPRQRMLDAAHRWVGKPSLTEEEREHIQAVWLQGEYRPALLPRLTRQRVDQLRHMLTLEGG